MDENSEEKVMEEVLQDITVGLSPNEVLRHPLMKQIITDHVQLDFIMNENNSTVKNNHILQNVRYGGQDAWKIFKRILRDTKHYKLLYLLYKKQMGISEDSSDLWPRIAQNALKACKNVMREDLDPNTTLDAFEEKDFIADGAHIRDIREQKTTTEKNELIYFEVDKQGVEGYNTLKNVLHDTKQTGVLASLQRAERLSINQLVTSQDIIEDCINYKLNKEGILCESPLRHDSNSKIILCERVRELSIEFEERYKSEMNRIVFETKPEMLTSEWYSVIMRELFIDGITWYRIIAIFSFAGALAAFCKKHGISQISILDCTVQFFEENIEMWVRKNGGWISIVDFVKESKGERPTEGADEIDGLSRSNNTKGQPTLVESNNTSSKSRTYTIVDLLLASAAGFALCYISKS